MSPQTNGQSSQTNGQTNTTPHRDLGLDVLRGIAILLVVDYHYTRVLLWPLVRLGFPEMGGHIGVSMFFVLSGFLVGGLLMREWKEKGTVRGGRFLVRRIFKIWPQYYLFLLVNLLSGHRTVHQLAGNLLNIQNYTGGIAHTWSLAVEEHAYLVLALFFAVAVRRTVSRRVVFWTLLLTAAVMIVARDVAVSRGVNVFLPTHFRADGILLGVLLAMVFHFAPERFRSLQRLKPLWWLLLVAAVVLLRFPGAHTYDEGDLIGIAALMLLAPIPGVRAPQRRSPMVARALGWIGLYSYGIYLWHVSVSEPTLHLLRRLPFAVPPQAAALLAAICGVTLGILMTKAVELPTLRLRDRLFPKRTHSPLEVGTEEIMR